MSTSKTKAGIGSVYSSVSGVITTVASGLELSAGSVKATAAGFYQRSWLNLAEDAMAKTAEWNITVEVPATADTKAYHRPLNAKESVRYVQELVDDIASAFN